MELSHSNVELSYGLMELMYSHIFLHTNRNVLDTKMCHFSIVSRGEVIYATVTLKWLQNVS